MKAGKGKWQVAGAIFLAGAFAAPVAHAAAPVNAFGDKVSVQLYGQINRALLYADDGNEGKLYFVDNKNSSTRFGFNAKAKVEGGMTIGGKFEVEAVSNSSNDINQDLEKTPFALNERHFDFYMEGVIGKLSLGQGDMASNETSEVDLSGTKVIAYSQVEELAGGIIFFDDKLGSIYSNPTEKDATKLKANPKVKDVFDNLDGLSRDDRVRYDTPKFAGFQLSASTTSHKAFDAALRYGAEFSGVKIEAAAAFADLGDSTKVSGGDSVKQFNGSVSVLMPFGLSFTGAAGQQKLDDSKRTEDPMFYYAKVGYTAKLFFAGSTSFAVDYSASNDMKADKDEANTIGAFVVQRVDAYGTELYAGYRTYQFDRTGKDFADVGGMMAGARIKF